MTLARHDVPHFRPVPAGRHRAAYPAGRPADDAPGGTRAACLRLCVRLRDFPPASWLALPAVAHADEHALERVLAGAAGAALTHAYAYVVIAAEAGRARRHGVRDATAPALLLLAAIALGQDGAHAGHERATLQLVESALALARRQGRLQHERALALQAALLPPGPAQAPGHFGTLAAAVLAHRAGRHAADIVRSVQRLASRQDTAMDKVAVDQTIADTLRLLQRPLRRHGIGIDLALGLGECIIQADRVQLQQVVNNLLVNAIEALSGQRARIGGPGAVRAPDPRAEPPRRYRGSRDQRRR